jgi:type IV pilus assembly protein PilV
MFAPRLSASFFSIRPRNDGFSLIEVLVALLVLSIGLLGLAALQATSIKYNTDSYTRTQATILAYDIIDRMRLNGTAVASGGIYDVPNATAAQNAIGVYNSCKTTSCACGTTSCDANNLAIYDLGQWYAKVTTFLPGASGNNLPTIFINGSRMVTVTMRWKERDLDNSQAWMAQL